MDSGTKKPAAVLAWGAFWGLAEATIGHLLHVYALPYGWLCWFPLAFFCLHRVYRQTGDVFAMLGAAAIAAALKFIDLLAPVRLDFVVNPAVSIILEGLAVGAFFGLARLREGGLKLGFGATLQLSLVWRGLYLLYALCLMPAAWRAISPLANLQSFLGFVFLESAANAVCIGGYLLLAGAGTGEAKVKSRFAWYPALSCLLFLAAVFVQWRL